MGKTLTPELIQMKCKTDKLSTIKNLNLWGNDLEDISLIKEMPNIEICSLSLNKIYSLKDFASCKKLAELYLRKNLVTELQEVKYLTMCPSLKVLWLWDNPIADHPFYRSYIIKILPNLVKLDNANVTPEERTQAQ
jgi:Leucine-rich repeat (LRR) protein